MNQNSSESDRIREALGNIEVLSCLVPMIEYYQDVYDSIKLLTKGDGRSNDILRVSPDQLFDYQRYIDADLEYFGLQFYLQRVSCALNCYAQKKSNDVCVVNDVEPRPHPCTMRRGFKRIADGGKPEEYSFEEFLGDTLPHFSALHSHLISINRSLGDLYYNITALPIATFTPIGKSEISHLTEELHRIMTGLLVATHLQPHSQWQTDLVNYLLSCRADCGRFLDSIPQYYQTHKLRLVIFPIDAPAGENEPYSEKGMPHDFPIACLPWCAGVYLDFLSTYRNIVKHALAVFHWAIRLHSLWHFVPRRVLRAISPAAS